MSLFVSVTTNRLHVMYNIEDVVSGQNEALSKVDVKCITLKEEYHEKSQVLTDSQHEMFMLSRERDSTRIKLRQQIIW